MNKLLIAGTLSGIVLTEILQYFAPQSAILFYCYVLLGAATASVISRRPAGGMIIAGYVVAWKVVSMVLLTRTYGVEAVARGFSPFLFDWTMVVLVGIAGGYGGAAMGKYVNSKSKML